jgi:hypothetical protein
MKNGKQKTEVINADRELFNRHHLVVVSNIRDIDLEDILSHELSVVPYSLANADGSLQNSKKSNFCMNWRDMQMS